MKVKDLKQDGHNYRKHSDRNRELIKKSVQECGLGRSVVIDADGVLIAGNGVASVLDERTPVRVIETDGSELVVVKRTDLHEGDEKRKRLALADNAAADAVEWDADNLRADFDGAELDGWDVMLPADINEEDVNALFEDAGEQKEKGLVIAVDVPKEYEDNLEDIKAAIRLTLAEWDGCKVK